MLSEPRPFLRKYFPHLKLTGNPNLAFVAALDDMELLLSNLPATSTYALINWMEVMFQKEHMDAVLSALHHRLNTMATFSDKAMTYVYLGLNFIGLLLSVASMQSWDMDFLDDDDTTTSVGSTWNYIDAIGGIMLAIRQIQQGELALGLVNIGGGMQLAALTATANIAKYTSRLNLSASTISAFMGFSFAACMFISGGVEFLEVIKSEQRLHELEKKRKDLHFDPMQCRPIQKAILVEYAQRENHLRSAKAWMACGVAMTAIAVVGYVALSGLTFGALPVATIIVAAAAFITGLVRKWWVGHKNYVENLKTTLHAKEDNLIDKLNHLASGTPCGLNLRQQVTIKDPLFSKTISLQQYIEKMIVHEPTKARAVLNALEGKEQQRVIDALGEHRSLVNWFKTTGVRIVEALASSAGNDALVISKKNPLQGAVDDNDASSASTSSLTLGNTLVE